MLKRNTFVGSCVREIYLPGRRLTSVLLLSFVSIFALFGLLATSHAQAIPTAEKGGVDAFGAFTFNSTDVKELSGSSQKDVGGAVGAALLFRRFSFGQLALAARYSTVRSSTTDQTFFGGGLESHYRVGPVRPYATILYGVGGLSLPNTTYSDSGNTILVGGGVDLPLSHKFAARGEFTYSFVNITGYNNTSVGEIKISPIAVNIGLVYHIK